MLQTGPPAGNPSPARTIFATPAGSHSPASALQSEHRHQPWSAVLGSAASSIAVSVTSGLLVPLIRALGILLWRRARVPSALSRQVRRRNYLDTVQAESQRRDVNRIDVYTPRLLPARDSKAIAGIQAGWEKINCRGRVRVLTTSNDESLQAGAELVDRGIEVRVLPDERGLGSDGLTFHLFETSALDDTTAILNHYRQGADRPARFRGIAPAEPFRSKFDAEWERAGWLESAITRRLLPGPVDCRGADSIRRSIEQAQATGLRLGAGCLEKIVPHLAFRDSCAVVFVLGLPGSGKSYVRSLLQQRLASMRIEAESLTDYPYAYQAFVRTALKLNPQNGNGFKAHEGGAFTVQHEKTLAPALHMLHSAVLDSMSRCEVTLVEFARSDLAAALEVFDDIRPRSQILYIRAAPDLRQARLAARAVPPEVRVEGQVVSLKLSDDHLLPEHADRTLYQADGLETIKASAHWRGRIFEIDNESDGRAHADAKTSEFIDSIVGPYQPAAGRVPGYAQPILAHA